VLTRQVPIFIRQEAMVEIDNMLNTINTNWPKRT
jgi:hypothetical protein